MNMKSGVTGNTKRNRPTLRSNRTNIPGSSSKEPVFFRIPDREALNIRESDTEMWEAYSLAKGSRWYGYKRREKK